MIIAMRYGAEHEYPPGEAARLFRYAAELDGIHQQLLAAAEVTPNESVQLVEDSPVRISEAPIGHFEDNVFGDHKHVLPHHSEDDAEGAAPRVFSVKARPRKPPHWVVKKNGCYLAIRGWQSLVMGMTHGDAWDFWVKPDPKLTLKQYNQKYCSVIQRFCSASQASGVAETYEGKAYRVQSKSKFKP